MVLVVADQPFKKLKQLKKYLVRYGNSGTSKIKNLTCFVKIAVLV